MLRRRFPEYQLRMLYCCWAGPLQAEYEEQALQTDTVWWAAPTSVLVSSTAYEGEVCPDP